MNKRWLKNRLDENLYVKANAEPVRDDDDWSIPKRVADTEFVRYIDVKHLYPYSMIETDLSSKDYSVYGEKDGDIFLSCKWSIYQSYVFRYNPIKHMRNVKLKQILP
jgi:hypothetical protein